MGSTMAYEEQNPAYWKLAREVLEADHCIKLGWTKLAAQ